MSRRWLNRREFAVSAANVVVSPLLLPQRSTRTSTTLRIAPPGEAFLATLPKLMEIGGVPGMAIGIVSNGKPQWERYLGVTDASSSKAVTAEALFPAASLGKPVFAHAVLKLVDEGRLDLDRPLKTYLADHTPADQRGDKVTARHVLSHSTGYRNWRNAIDQQLIPEFDPGSRFQYSGEGFYYLQRVVEKIAGMGFEQFMQERLLTPLGMRSSTYSWRTDTEARLVTGHNRGTAARQPNRDFANRLLEYAQGKNKPLASFTHEDVIAAMSTIRPAPPALPNFLIPNAAGSLLTTVTDYASFLNRLLVPGGSGDLRSATRQQLLTPQSRINSALAWGLGWGLESDHGREYLWHWGDNGNFKNFVLAHPPSRSAVVVFTNGSNGLRIAERIVTAASGHEHPAFVWV